MQTETIVSKGMRNGWQAVTKFDMGECKDHHGEPARRELRIRTAKTDRGGLYTSATCATVRPDGMIMWAVFGDYHRRLIESPSRCTEKSVREQHAHALTKAEALLAEARAFYEAKDQPQRVAA